MQDLNNGESTSPPLPRESNLPLLAPRLSQSSTAEKSSASTETTTPSGRPPRPSNRSRAGCWTCRGRKVKCDETRPRCGPCTRLNRECDWEQRWNFSNATATTQSKYVNVSTAGNAVWDPHARQSQSVSPTQDYHDDLPAFAALTNDEDREKKAVRHRPGHYGVVVTPESFVDLPEYNEEDHHPGHSGQGVPNRSLGRPHVQQDVTTVVLQRFEDISTPSVLQMPESSDRRSSIPSALQRLRISSSPLLRAMPATSPGLPVRARSSTDSHLAAHFQTHLVRQLVQPLRQDSTSPMFEQEAQQFLPLHHAMCALSSIHLSIKGLSSLETALEHYHEAIASSATPTTTRDLLSDGVFLRHLLLFVYDICCDDGSHEMWAQHLNRLRHIAVARQEPSGTRYGYALWLTCELDIHACLMGSGSCDFTQAILQENKLPPIEQQIPFHGLSTTGSYLPFEATCLPAILHLRQGLLFLTAKLAQLAQVCRIEHAGSAPVAPATYAYWETSVQHLQTEISRSWTKTYQDLLGSDAIQIASNLPPRARHVFEHAFLLYQTAIIYSRTSLFPGQRLVPVAHSGDVHLDTERRCISILNMARSHLENGEFERRHVIFSLLLAGFATTQPNAKVQAIDMMRAFETTGGIGRNTARARQLLSAVCDEQQKRIDEGGRLEQVDWLVLARERGLSVVNCGL